jgi:hypothetical protein
MLVVKQGRPDKTGRRQVNCFWCEAILEITNADIRAGKRETLAAGSKESWDMDYFVCPECNSINVVNNRPTTV